MRLYTYWRSTSSYRVRIALALKNLEPEQIAVHLVRNGGEQHSESYRALNPQGRVPALATDDNDILTQSPAIIEYLEEVYPQPPLLPSCPVARAKARSIAAIIGCDIHPLHNVSPLNYLRKQFGVKEDELKGWIGTWIEQGFQAIEASIQDTGYCLGDAPGLADVYLIPQVYAARRFEVDLDPFPRIRRVEALALRHSAFQKAHPANQLDAE